MAARAWFNDDPARAVMLYDAILVDRPHDVLALAVTHALDFRLGRRCMMCDRIARVLPHGRVDSGLCERSWDVRLALEENGEYRNAPKESRSER